MQDFQLSFVMPVAILAGYGLLCLLMAPFFRRGTAWINGIAVLGVISAAVSLVSQWTAWRSAQSTGATPLTTAGDMVRVDGFGIFAALVVLTVGLLSLLVSYRMLEREESEHGEYYALMLFSLAGMVMMVETANLLMLLVGLEVFSLSLYVLCGLTRSRVRSIESALKYFLLGAFSSGFLVFGLALVYGAAGSLGMARVAEAVAAGPSPLLWMGAGLVFVGLAFKIAVVPFHAWVPDVYQGAPTHVTGFMAAATKTVAFAAMIRFLVGAFAGQGDAWAPLITWLAILTMTVANVVALVQTNIKRMLAFSSIAHAGYLLIALVCLPGPGVKAILFYLATYAFMTIGAFAIAGAVGRETAGSETGYDLASWAGLGRRQPWIATAMTVFLLSMAGIPSTGGFFGKYLIFQAAIESKLYLLAVVGSLNAVIAATYYLRVIIAMWMKEPDEEPLAQPVPAMVVAALVVSVVAVFYLGLAPARVLALVDGLAQGLV